MTPPRSPLPAVIFRLLLRAYPAWFRHAHGAEMEQLFEARIARVTGVRAAAAFWTLVAGDLITTALALRRRRRARRHRSRVEGLVGGLAIAAFTVARLEAVLFGVEPFDLVTFASAAAAIAAVAWLAAYLPARRAAGADPVKAFRAT